MADEKYTFSQARVRLEEIVAQVRKKDVSLEKSIELLEEGVRLANQCTELSDHSEWQTVVEEQTAGGDADPAGIASPDVDSGDAEAPDPQGEDPGDAVSAVAGGSPGEGVAE